MHWENVDYAGGNDLRETLRTEVSYIIDVISRKFVFQQVVNREDPANINITLLLCLKNQVKTH